MIKKCTILLLIAASCWILVSCRQMPSIPMVSELLEDARERLGSLTFDLPGSLPETAAESTPTETDAVSMTPIEPRTEAPDASEPTIEFKYPIEDTKTSVATVPPDTESPSADTDNTLAGQVASLVNKERAKAGLSPLAFDVALSANADVRAEEIVRSFSHTRPDGRSCMTAITVSYRTAGENIAAGQRTADEVMNGWMNSEGHRANILNSAYTKIGVGVTESGGRLYWVQLFVG